MIEELVKAAVAPVIPVCVPWQYSGEAMEYCVFAYSEIPDAFGDDEAGAIRYVVQLHWFFPWAPNVTADPEVQRKKQAIRAALKEAGFTTPSIEYAGDGEWMDFVYECEILGEV